MMRFVKFFACLLVMVKEHDRKPETLPL